MRRIAVVVGILAVALVGAIVAVRVLRTEQDAVVVVHWSNGHPMRDGLLPQMVEEFNDAGFETSTGSPIEVRLVRCDSAAQADDLVDRVHGGSGSANGCKSDGEPAPDPTIVTPQSSDWLVDVNHRAGSEVFDLDATLNIAETYMGIVTYREMAECLGWPDRSLGYADIIALRSDPDGWADYACASPKWGKQPKLSFTNPRTSTTGRNVLVSLYSTAVGKPPAEITLADIRRPEVVAGVQDVTELVDHYLPTTTALNTKIAQGVRFGHFFLLPEDNLVSLQRGDEKAIGDDGTEQQLTDVGDLVMLYPTEGSVLNANPAGLVEATWVTPEQVDGANVWIDFLRDEDRQLDFMAHGFRPATGTGLTPDPAQFKVWGLDPAEPHSISPGDLQPEVLEGIVESWSSVKKPSIVTFVVDVSGSMTGEPLEAVQAGMEELLEEMANANDPGNDSQVGLVTFASEIQEEVAPVSISRSKYDVYDAVGAMKANGSTALYDAIGRAIELTDAATGRDGATRAVVVLSDGAATEGRCLTDVVSVSSSLEVDLTRYCGMQGESPVDDAGNAVRPEQLLGQELIWPHEHDDIQVFFVGFGEADLDIGRVLAQATDAEFQASSDDALAEVIEALSGYF